MKKGITKKEFLKKAQKQGASVHKNRTKRAKSLSKICGSITTSYPATTEELLRR